MKYSLENDIVYDSNTGHLYGREGVCIHLRNTENLLLLCLLGGLEEKRDIIKSVWPATIVTDSSYYKLIFDLRNQMSAVGLDQNIIKTIPRRGVAYTGQWKVLGDDEFRQAVSSATINLNEKDIELPVATTHPGGTEARKLMDVHGGYFQFGSLLSINNGFGVLLRRCFFYAIAFFFVGGVISFIGSVLAGSLLYETKNIKGIQYVFVGHGPTSINTSFQEKPELVYLFQSTYERVIFECHKVMAGKVKCENQITYF